MVQNCDIISQLCTMVHNMKHGTENETLRRDLKVEKCIT